MNDKLGTYINRLMTTIVDKENDEFVRDLALSELKNLNLKVEEFLRDNIKDDEFKFYLLTGIGKKSGQNVIAETAEVHDLPSATSTVSIINKSNITMEKTKGKLHAWEKDAKGKQSKAAKLFYTIYTDRTPIINLEVRYKGSYTANPQFQAVATANFKELFK